MFKLVLKHFIRELALTSLFDALTRNFPVKTICDLTDAEKLEIVKALTNSLYDYPNSIIDSYDIPIIVDMVKDQVNIDKASVSQFVTELIHSINERNIMEANLPLANAAYDSDSDTGRCGMSPNSR